MIEIVKVQNKGMAGEKFPLKRSGKGVATGDRDGIFFLPKADAERVIGTSGWTKLDEMTIDEKEFGEKLQAAAQNGCTKHEFICAHCGQPAPPAPRLERRIERIAAGMEEPITAPSLVPGAKLPPPPAPGSVPHLKPLETLEQAPAVPEAPAPDSELPAGLEAFSGDEGTPSTTTRSGKRGGRGA